MDVIQPQLAHGQAKSSGATFPARYLAPPGGSSPLIRTASALLLVLLAGIFVTASLAKFGSLAGPVGDSTPSEGSAIDVVHYRLKPYIPTDRRYFTGAIAAVELVLGASILATRLRKSAALAAGGLAFAVFTLALVLSRKELAGSGCGCIGAGVLEFSSLAGNVARNVLLMAGCLALAHLWKQAEYPAAGVGSRSVIRTNR